MNEWFWEMKWIWEVVIVGVLAIVCVLQRICELQEGNGMTREPFSGFGDDRERDLSKPFIAHETVPFSLLFPVVIAVVSFDIIVRSSEVLRRTGRSEAFEQLAGTVMCALQCFFGSIAASQLLKDNFCRLRPDYVDRERIYKEEIARAVTKETTTSFFTAETLADGRISFPSGHATLMTAEFLLLILWRIHDAFIRPTRSRIVTAVIYTVVLSAIDVIVCISRVLDNRHHISDVVVGALVGAVVAVLSHLHWHRNICSAHNKKD